jgi:hypothetical protein
LQHAHAAAELALHGRQRDVDDRRVEDDHEVAETDGEKWEVFAHLS